MKRRRFIQIAAACAVLPGRSWPRSSSHRIALGAETSITLYGPKEVTEPALAEAEDLIERIERLFSLYRPNSALSELNRSGQLENPPPELVELLRMSAHLHKATGGRFDPTVQPLWRALSEGRDPSAARKLIGFDRVVIADNEISLAPAQELTLNGIAQGYATDLVTDAIARRGLTQALVNIGEHRALGGPFRLGLEDPISGLLGHMNLSDQATASSSPDALRVSESFEHILNPTGPSRTRWSTVNVVASRAALADGLSTALCFSDVDEIRAIAARLQEPVRIRVVDGQGDLRTI